MILWLKAFHIIGFTAWFAGIFYIWRLFVYHAETTSEDVRNQLAIMEYKLYKYIMRPAMVVTLFFGFALLYLQWEAFFRSAWIWLKLCLVALVLANHFMAESYRKKLARGMAYKSRIFRILNEMPTVLLIGIVLLVVLKPF
ncbi:MAG TPA: protoporphyrinogen oxidase HemJ [Leptospiraceae bacterium]|jgi:putative membrane protein|nr:protoporphyrinogen oxidase HemJ [Leptospirales bacterium]HMX56353.1 protoporphyrinogen oxidase HemJ [Leptospiraceae bacterium]HMY47604.1 protoporphyrinogen oxidase HemJ [Leptospiraceae bacterium]HMZ36074.1 protoporphyrinogen oxidase HemJ [Leptospiraceae bacterium]HNE22797.1 protoporphyrinogen oxidase HemJ [Leptospiraceae bacterium]